MRIVSFLPSATEMLFALGLDSQVVGVTFECDYPAAANRCAQVVHSHLPPGLSAAEIDALVRSEGAQGRSLYFADFALLEELSPDLVLLQDLCHVCALDSPTIARDLQQLPSHPQLLSLSAHTLDGVLEDIARVGEATGAVEQASRLLLSLRERLVRVQALPPPASRPRVLALEWLQPFFQGGHWIPEMIAMAGGDAVLAVAGEKSVQLSWEAIQAADPDIVIIMPCGYHLEETVEQYSQQSFPPGWEQLRAVQQRQVYAVDGSAYFSRPGPRLVEGVEILANVFRGQVGPYRRL